MNEIKIDVNNGITLIFAQNNKDDAIGVYHKYNNGDLKCIDTISAADMVSLLNWHHYQKSIGNNDLTF